MFEQFLEFFMKKEIFISIAVIIVAFIVYFLIKKIIHRIMSRNESNSKIDRKRKTYMKLFNNIIKYILIILTVLAVMQINGINVSSLIAGLGLASAIAGLALQDALKDIIMGVNIIVDDYFSVGDVVKIKDVEGKVIEVGLKTTKIKDVKTNDTFVIANRNIGEATNISTQLDIDVPLPYERKVEDIENVLSCAINKIEQMDEIVKTEYRGIQEFGDSAIFYKLRLYCKPEFKPQVKRDANRIIKLELDANNIEIPYTQIDLHQKN
ncbi:MAG: mechanosensitive ion channel family protein [Clostridia bacterium]|nr:mechanosensitive ion channel family protein [Clostridia bacterium]